MSTLVSATPACLLRGLAPYKRILSVVRRKGVVGVAVSDPHLSFAVPLTGQGLAWAEASRLVDGVSRLSAEVDAEALLVGLPISAPGAGPCAEALREQRELQLALLEGTPAEETPRWRALMGARGGDMARVKEQLAENLLWDSLKLDQSAATSGDPSRLRPSQHAAVSLQMWLDEHGGGWANTFG